MDATQRKIKLDVARGDTLHVIFRFKDKDGNCAKLNGCSAKITAYAGINSKGPKLFEYDSDPPVVISEDTGEVQFKLEETVTPDLPTGIFPLRCQITTQENDNFSIKVYLNVTD